MSFLKKKRAQNPPKAPCGHVPPVFRTVDGRMVTILVTPVIEPIAFIDIPPKVWCDIPCGWVKISMEQYNEYRRFNGHQAT